MKHLLIIVLAATLAAPMQRNVMGENAPDGYINYEMYGAAGDGVHDDMAAIIAAHKAAGELDLPVKVTGGKTYYISGREKDSAVILTDTDFSDARFIIDDSASENCHQPVFVVASRQKPVPVTGIGKLRKGQKSLGVKLPGRCLVEVVNSDRKVYIRYGLNQNGGTPQREVLIADAKGRIDKSTALVWDYDKVTMATAYPMDETPLSIKGGRFTMIANQAESKYDYHFRGMAIRRSNVTVEGLRFDITGELDHGAPYDGFIMPQYAVNVLVKDCVLTPHFTYGTIGAAGKPVKMGSYAISVLSCCNVRFERCSQTVDINDRRYWGLFTSNFCKNLSLEDCEMSRFDAHQGVENVFLKNCRLGYMGVQLVGFGTLRIEDCVIYRDRMIVLRDDYGSSWDGEMVIRNCTLIPGNTEKVYLIRGTNTGTHDFGYSCCLPSRLTVDGLAIDDSAVRTDTYLFSGFDRDSSRKDLLPLRASGTIVLKNIRTATGKPLLLSPESETFAGYKVKGL